jgi:hypothetical protein
VFGVLHLRGAGIDLIGSRASWMSFCYEGWVDILGHGAFASISHHGLAISNFVACRLEMNWTGNAMNRSDWMKCMYSALASSEEMVFMVSWFARQRCSSDVQ